MRLRTWDSPLRSTRAAAVVCAALAVLVYANSLGNAFAYDDLHILPNNPAIQSLETLPEALLEPYWPGDFGRELGLWRPVMTAVLGLQWVAWGDQPTLFHLVNVLAHGAATALVVVLVSLLGTVPVALVAGLLFAVHPVHVEAVANIVGLAEVLAAVFLLAACVVHVRAGDRHGPGALVGITVLYLLGFLTKESAVVLPGLVFVLDAARERLGPRDLPSYVRRRWALYAVLAAAAAAVLLVRYTVLGSIASPLGPLGAHLLEAGVPRIWTLAEIWAHWVRLLVFPQDLVSDYSPNVLPIALGWNALAVSGAILALAILALAWATWRGGRLGWGSESPRWLGFGVVWFMVAVSPVSNVFFLAGVLLAERTLYLPSVGFVAGAAWVVVRLARERRRAAVALLAVVLVLGSVRTWTRTPTWRDNITVFGTLITDYPQSGRAQWIMGDLFFRQDRMPESLQAYRAAIGILGGHYQLLTEIGKKLIGAGMYDAAIHVLTKAWRDWPGFNTAPAYLATAHYQQGNLAQAERFGRTALTLQRADPVTSHILASALTDQGRYREALGWRLNAIREGEGDRWEQWIWLARLHLSTGDSAAAAAARDSARARASTRLHLRRIDSLYTPHRPPAGPL